MFWTNINIDNWLLRNMKQYKNIHAWVYSESMNLIKMNLVLNTNFIQSDQLI